MRWVERAIVLVVGTLGAETACGPAHGPPASAARPALAPIAFEYRAVDGSLLSSETTRGRVTAIAFITTYDLPSQVLVRQLSRLAHERGRRFNVGIVVLEPPKNAPLVETFASTLELTFPVALADQATLQARGPFGAIEGVPTVAILDPAGAPAARFSGVVSEADLRNAIERAWRTAP